MNKSYKGAIARNFWQPHAIPFKVVRRLISNFERKRRYSIREHIWGTQWKTKANHHEGSILILTTNSYATDAAWCAASFLLASERLRDSFGLHFVVNEEEAMCTVDQLARTFPDARISSRDEVLTAANKLSPSLCRFSRYHPLGVKLASVLLENQSHRLLYTDSDVLAFNPLPELEDQIFSEKPAYTLNGPGEAYDPHTRELAVKYSMVPAARVNTGTIMAPPGYLTARFVADLVPDDKHLRSQTPTWWWIEQTIMAALLGQESLPLPEDKYVVSSQASLPFEKDVNYKHIAIRHFIGSVRHRMYSRGMPLLKKRILESQG